MLEPEPKGPSYEQIPILILIREKNLRVNR